MKYEKPNVEVVLTDEEDIIRTSGLSMVDPDDDEDAGNDKNWSGFF